MAEPADDTGRDEAATAPKPEQTPVPLQWTSTAAPIAAKVIAAQDGVYRVSVLVNVTSTTPRSPTGPGPP